MRGLGAFAGVSNTRGTHPVARIFILGFSLKTSLSVAPIFSAFTSPQSTPLNFFVFQNPAVCYFAHIASIAENKIFEICVFRGHHARIFLYFKVPWWLRYVSVKSVQADIYRRARQAVAKPLTAGLLKGKGGMFIGVEGFGSRCRGLGAFAGVSDTRGTHPVTRFFILGFFAQNVTFGRTNFFQHSPHPKAPP